MLGSRSSGSGWKLWTENLIERQPTRQRAVAKINENERWQRAWQPASKTNENERNLDSQRAPGRDQRAHPAHQKPTRLHVPGAITSRPVETNVPACPRPKPTCTHIPRTVPCTPMQKHDDTKQNGGTKNLNQQPHDLGPASVTNGAVCVCLCLGCARRRI